MVTNFLSRDRVGCDKFKGYEIYKLYADRENKQFKEGCRFVIFKDGLLVCEERTEREANQKYTDGALDGFLKRDYLGLNEKLR